MIENCKCVGGNNMRGYFPMKVYLIAIYNRSVTLGYFLMWVYLILSEPTQISTPVKPIKHVIAFSLNVSQRRDIDSPMWNFMTNLMVPKTWLGYVGFESFI